MSVLLVSQEEQTNSAAARLSANEGMRNKGDDDSAWLPFAANDNNTVNRGNKDRIMVGFCFLVLKSVLLELLQEALLASQ